MNCWDVLCSVLGEEALHVVRTEDGSDTLPGKINVLCQWEALFQVGGAFALTDQGHAVIILPTLVSTDPLHLAIAIHEAHHAKRWLKHRRVNDKGIPRLLEERATNNESMAFAKTIATGTDLEDMRSVFRMSDVTYNPILLAQGFLLAHLMKCRLVYLLVMKLVDLLVYRKTGEDFTTQFNKRQARLMNLPELGHEIHLIGQPEEN